MHYVQRLKMKKVQKQEMNKINKGTQPGN